ncbi:hypothetical protein O7R03_22060 [Vibrio parahaemolyticus]|uniref:hypothetical protein n=1 Tax=Vibrio parahaemolyticus TaxID=670 RepID=UPI001DD0E3B6|nr:hypothetical protein [Vibrio parahaemolyticus]MBE4253756.1 hypothetical protein [Vibrio parahaemolyticus]MDA0403940.1 hypothetical protein [Vibrio parahaemolyticus]
MTKIRGVYLDRPVEFTPYINSGCSSRPINEGHTYILEAKFVEPFINELDELNQLALIKETLQSLCVKTDGTYLLTAFPELETFKSVALRMKSVPNDLMAALIKWEALGANEVNIDFVQNLSEPTHDEPMTPELQAAIIDVLKRHQ